MIHKLDKHYFNYLQSPQDALSSDLDGMFNTAEKLLTKHGFGVARNSDFETIKAIQNMLDALINKAADSNIIPNIGWGRDHGC